MKIKTKIATEMRNQFKNEKPREEKIGKLRVSETLFLSYFQLKTVAFYLKKKSC